ncbi:MAG: VOC family protein [Alphaproteobacteria bacterium]|nr:VOC family protein [Alphaproteobacteria bacterium]
MAIATFTALGLRPIVSEDDFAVMELRGGTHLVLRRAAAPRRVSAAPFDLMYDDVAAARRRCQSLRLRPTALKRGRIHDWFTFVGPGRHRFTVYSSHASQQPV